MEEDDEVIALIKKYLPAWLKRSIRNTIWGFRQRTWRYRALPDFIIIGAQKAGTTSLFAYLEQHPQILPSYKKELEYFDGGKYSVDLFAKGEGWYRAHFPLKTFMGHDKKTFEASPSYIFNPNAPKRIFDRIPDVKMILLLRNPTERAISQYFHMKRLHAEELPLMEALMEEENRLAPILKNKDYNTRKFDFWTYKMRGKYEEQIQRYLKYFPREQILIIDSDELYQKPKETLEQIYAFVGVDNKYIIKDLKPRNVSTNRNRVDPKVFEYLNDFFHPYNQKLYDLIGKKYDW